MKKLIRVLLYVNIALILLMRVQNWEYYDKIIMILKSDGKIIDELIIQLKKCKSSKTKTHVFMIKPTRTIQECSIYRAIREAGLDNEVVG